MKVFAGNGCPLLAEKIVQSLGQSFGRKELAQFSDGEINVEILEHVRGEDTFIIQSTCQPANDNLMELAIIADALKRSEAHRIVAVIPYYGYSRQDRRPDFKRTSITSRLVADLLQAAGVTNVITVDIHSDQQQGFFSVPFVNVYASTIMVNHVKTRLNCHDTVVVSPDFGGVKRARAVSVAANIDSPIAIIDKRRPRPNVSEVMNVIGDVDGRNCIMVDDAVDTAGTLCNAASALKKNGAKGVYAYTTHPILSGGAVLNIQESAIDKLVVTDTIPLSKGGRILQESGRLEVISVAELLASSIARIANNDSISAMYGELANNT